MNLVKTTVSALAAVVKINVYYKKRTDETCVIYMQCVKPFNSNLCLEHYSHYLICIQAKK